MTRSSDASRLWAAIQTVADTRTLAASQLYDAYNLAFPDRIGAGTVDQTLYDALNVLQDDGYIRLSARRHPGTNPPLPSRITRTDIPPAPRTDHGDWYGIRWHEDLRWAAGLGVDKLPHPSTRSTLTCVNDWLKSNPDRRTVAREERSLEIFGDEKAITNQRGGEDLWAPGRLTSTLLAFEPVPLPMVTTDLANPTDTILVVENAATFDSATHALTEDPGRYRAVGWGDGKSLSKLLPSIPDQYPQVRTVHYFGDLDTEGVNIAAKAGRYALSLDLQLVPAIDLYCWLLDVGRHRTHVWKLGKVNWEWLSDPILRDGVDTLILNQLWLPQEGLTRTMLADDRSWRYG